MAKLQNDGRLFSMIGLVVFAVDKAVVSLINIAGGPYFVSGFYVFDLMTIFFNWLLPLLIVFRIEKRDSGSLGLKIEPRRRYLYLLLVLIGFVLPSFFIGISKGLFVEFFEQIAFIGLPEEFFYRGYLMGRFREWLGDFKGLLLNAVVFSIAHLIFLFTRHDFTLVWGDLVVGFQTLMGGLLLGYIYFRAEDIVPSSILHISLNVYLSRL
jgi:membrane protease YdiL (CAAX protease family)